MSVPIWFFWSGDHLTFLRWMTLASACHYHDDVVLVRRMDNERDRLSKLKAAEHWHEHQDFQRQARGKNWLEHLPSSVRTVALHEVAPEIAELAAPDVHTSDLLAWWILAEHGGTAADMDIVFIRPLPEITHPIQLVLCTGWPLTDYMPIGFMQGQPSPFWRTMYQRARERYDPNVYQSCGGPCFPPWPEIPEPKRLLSEYVVYPFALRAEWMLWHPWMFESETWPEIPEECVGIHWYGGKNQKFNWTVDEDGVETMPGAVPWAVRKVLAELKVPA